MPCSDGTFQRVDEFEPGAEEAELVEIIDDDTLVDTVAYQHRSWWLECNIATVLGADELEAAWWQGRPARLLETPADFVAAQGEGACILDWDADVNAIIGRVDEVQCATRVLYERLRATLARQAMPRGLTITVAE